MSGSVEVPTTISSPGVEIASKPANRELHFKGGLVVSENTSVTPPRVEIDASGITVAFSSVTPQAIGTAAAGDEAAASHGNHVHAHENQLGGSLHALAVAGVSHGFMSATHASNIPTADEKAAMFGTAGTPSGSNEFVTNDDPRLDNASGTDPGLMSSAHYTRVNNATDAATVSTLILRDANGRGKVVDPSADSDIDTKGARNTAIAAAATVGGDYAWLPSRYAAASATFRTVTATPSTGTRFYLTKAARISGVEFCWKLDGINTPETVGAKLWDVSNVQLASGSVVVTASGLAYVTFSSSIAAPAYTVFVVAVSGTAVQIKYTGSGTTIAPMTAPGNAGGGLWWMTFGLQTIGVGVCPTTLSGENYPVAPIIIPA